MADEGSSSSSNPTSPPLGWEDGHVVPEELKVLSEPLKVKTVAHIVKRLHFLL